MKILHILIGMGSAALVAAVSYACKVTKINHKGQRSIKKTNNKKIKYSAVLHQCCGNGRRQHGQNAASANVDVDFFKRGCKFMGMASGDIKQGQIMKVIPGSFGNVGFHCGGILLR